MVRVLPVLLLAMKIVRARKFTCSHCKSENLAAPHSRVKSDGDYGADMISPAGELARTVSFSSSAVMNLSRLGLSFSRRTRLIGFESISSLSKAIERIFERQARSRLTLAGVLGLGRSSLSCLVGVANRSRLNFSIIIGLMSRRCFSPKKSLSVTERCSSSR